ncbi:hypothetical protein C2E20_4744 [Micractinium conductrix]|uniref:Uncharacterized protein n=1 Tax=Micractinium conductrix TaxID=554055 RepID=A0A2P6VD42_9CHLO|nr:hypothetical protein C2E20_4744 [Micractinium conductrix]|eukprot:PSC71999.1 hypothetical protein C2E20_4744 [Micractinium conductrix]
MEESTVEQQPQGEAPAKAEPSLRYSREELLALRDRPGCRGLPPGLEADDLSDLQESCFFDKSPTLDGGIYLGPQRGPGGPRAPFGAAAARRPAVGAGPIHSRLIEEEERGAYQRTNSGQLAASFGSPTKPQAIGPARAAGPPGLAPPAAGAARYEDPSKMDRWDRAKVDRNAGGAEDNWQQQKGRDNWRGGGGGGGGVRGSMDAGNGRGGGAAGGGGGWGGREAAPPADELQRAGSSAPKDGNRWVRDEDDWRARKQAGAPPARRYDWSDSRAVAGAAARGPPPGFGGHAGTPEWAEEAGGRPKMTAADIEEERQRMQAQWKKGGGTAHGAAQSSMHDFMSDDEIARMMAEEDDRQGRSDSRAAAAAAAPANGRPAAPPHAGQHIDVGALLGGRPQPGSPTGGVGSPLSGGGARSESMTSRFANFFKLSEDGAPGSAAASAAAPAPAAAAAAAPAVAPAPATQQGELQQLTLQQHLNRAAAGTGASPPPVGAPPANAGQALLAMLKQQQAVQRAAAGGVPQQQLPPNAVSAADVSVLEEADKVARLTALQGLDDDILGSPTKLQPLAQQQQQQQQQHGLPPGMHPGMHPGMPPPGHHPGHPQQQQLGGPPQHGMPQGFPGQLPPGMGLPHHHMQHPGHMPPPPGHFPPHGMPHMHPPQPGMQAPPPGMQYRPAQAGMQPGMQYRPPAGLPPGMQHPGMPPPQLPPQQQQQPNALLAQLLAAQARGPAPQQQVHPGQQVNLAALLGAAGNHGLQLPPIHQQALNPAQLQGMRPPQGMHGMMHPGMPAPGGLPPGINPALLQQLQMHHQMQLQQQQQQQQQQQRSPMPPQQQMSSAQLMAALGLAQQGMPPQGLR